MTMDHHDHDHWVIDINYNKWLDVCQLQEKKCRSWWVSHLNHSFLPSFPLTVPTPPCHYTFLLCSYPFPTVPFNLLLFLFPYLNLPHLHQATCIATSFSYFILSEALGKSNVLSTSCSAINIMFCAHTTSTLPSHHDRIHLSFQLVTVKTFYPVWCTRIFTSAVYLNLFALALPYYRPTVLSKCYYQQDTKW